jgi:hypothetical protein
MLLRGLDIFPCVCGSTFSAAGLFCSLGALES